MVLDCLQRRGPCRLAQVLLVVKHGTYLLEGLQEADAATRAHNRIQSIHLHASGSAPCICGL